MSIPVLHDIGAVIMTKNNVIADPGTGNTFNQNGMAYGTATVGAGAYKLPDNGLPMFVRTTAVAEIQAADSLLIAVIPSGRIALFFPLTATTWSYVLLDSASTASLSVAKVTTSSTTTTVVPGAGALSGANNVYWENTADGALALTTRTATEILTDILGVDPSGTGLTTISYLLTIVNRGNNTITITGGTDVSIVGEATIATLVTRTYVVEVTAAAVTMTSVAKGTIET